jgi:hypothetical protein
MYLFKEKIKLRNECHFVEIKKLHTTPQKCSNIPFLPKYTSTKLIYKGIFFVCVPYAKVLQGLNITRKTLKTAAIRTLKKTGLQMQVLHTPAFRV